MNIFYLNNSPQTSARYVVNKHTSKMIVESAQMLANCYTLDRLASPDCPRTQKGSPRKYSYAHHPCSIWAKKSLSNFNWLLEHAIYLYEEKLYRTNKGHFCIDFIKWCFDNQPDIEDIGLTTPALAFKNYECFQDKNNPVLSYQRFYVADKQYSDDGRYMAIYTKRTPPNFWEEFLTADELKIFQDFNKSVLTAVNFIIK